MLTPQYTLDLNNELIIDNFAGGGGASTGIELALGRHVDIAINHDPKAVAMHMANHPQTKHYCESVWDVDPREVSQGRPIGLVWLSPDCKHFSKAKGGKPVEKKIRGLAWVALKWASLPNKPRLIVLENVEEFVTWGPLDETGKPCKKNKGREFKSFVNALKAHGYTVDHKELRASDYGTPTIRKRLFLVARCDGAPIVWPEITHGDPSKPTTKANKLKPWRTAAECIDWSIPCPSIFGRKKPLAEATNRRIAKGIMRYVVNAAEPFTITTDRPVTNRSIPRSIDMPLPTATASQRIALVAPYLTEFANASNDRNMPTNEPLRTQCAQVKGGHFALVSAFISTYYGEKDGPDGRGMKLNEPLRTQTTENRHALVAGFLAKNYTGVIGSSINTPIGTVTTVDHHSLVSAHIQRDFGTSIGHAADEPLATVTATFGGHAALVESFLIKYYGNDGDVNLADPLHTITTKDRFGLVTVHGEKYLISDIGLRMMAPRELFRAQGFPEHYIIDKGMAIDNKTGRIVWVQLTKTEQVRMCGNSVCPPVAAAIISANFNNQPAQIAA